MLKSLTNGFLSLAIAALFMANVSHAGIQDPRNCVRQYKLCLDNCLQQENNAKRAKEQCEASARNTYNNSNKDAAARAAYDAALKACRDKYNSDMQTVRNCRQNCYNNYQNCIGNLYN